MAGRSHRGIRTHRRRRPTHVGAAALAVALLATGCLVSSASAFRTWCRSDPLIVIEGNLADIFVSAPVEELDEVKGPTQIVVVLPKKVKARLVAKGPGFLKGETVSFETSKRLR